MHLVVVSDDEFGSVAAAIDSEGRIIATAADSIRDGTYIAVDEANLYMATGQLLPAAMWERAKRR